MSEMFSHYRVQNDHQVKEIHSTSSSSSSGNELSSYVDQLSHKLKIEITRLNEESIEFDLIGVDAAIANALRRILLAEVPTIAIEHVWIAINSSIIQDEVLAHRVGLIPIKVDPRKLDYVVNDEETDRDTIVFHFDIECSPEKTVNKYGKECYKNEDALSSSLTWLPQGNQTEIFPGELLLGISYFLH
jgi:DNA-directed RNA polymerase I and III subunit RPAC1